MGAALLGVDVVCKRENIFLVGCVVLHCYLNLSAVFFLFKTYDWVQWILVLIKEFNKRGNAALVKEVMLFVGSFIKNCYIQPPVKKCELPKPACQSIKMKFSF